MPNVLLFGCDRELVKRLAADPRWNVAIGMHGEPVSPGTPDPRHWQLVLDDCGKSENEGLSDQELPEIPRYRVSEGYLEEAERAHGIRLCGGTEHFWIWSNEPEGHRMVEFNPARNSQCVEHLIDFIEKFEDKFSHACLAHPGTPQASHRRRCEPIFCDSYGCPVLEFHNYHFPLLCSIDMVDKGTRIDALFYLCQVTVPRLWPKVYSDLFRPRRVVKLEEERARVIAKRREEVADIEQKIQEELDFYAPYTNLPWVGHDELKRVVGDVFSRVFGLAVKDLDAELKEGEPKTLDLIVECGGWSAMVEVRGSSNRNARIQDLEKLDDNYERAKRVYGESDSKLLVFNGMFGQEAEERRVNPTFSQLVVDEAKIRGIGLLSAEELLRAIESHRNEEMPVERFVEALRSPGLLQPPWEG